MTENWYRVIIEIFGATFSCFKWKIKNKFLSINLLVNQSRDRARARKIYTWKICGMICQSMLMHTPSAKTIPDIKGSRQEGEIRNTRNYRLLLVRRWLQGPIACARTQRVQYLRAGRRRMFWSRWPERGRAPYTDLLKHGMAVAANRVLIISGVPATLFEKNSEV